MHDEKYKPDLISYSTLLSAWARSNDAGAAKQAEEILLTMHADYVADFFKSEAQHRLFQ
jgi:hypothetical protein